jgi:hypothetical protein
MVIRKEIKKQGYMLGYNPVSMIKYSRKLQFTKNGEKQWVK